MLKTIKLPTIIWAAAALAMFPFYMPQTNKTGPFVFQLLLCLIAVWMASETYRAVPQSPSRRENLKIAAHVIGGGVMLGLALVLAIGTGRLSESSLGFSMAGIEGRYTDRQGFAVEFLADGTLLADTSNGQLVMNWAAYDGNRIKLEGRGFGANAAMCTYEASTSMLKISGCPVAMTLTRL